MKTVEEWKEILQRYVMEHVENEEEFGETLISYIEAIRQEQREVCYEAFSRIEDLEDQGTAMLIYDNWRKMMQTAILTAGTEEYEKAWNNILTAGKED